jgi:hypothetical protein
MLLSERFGALAENSEAKRSPEVEKFRSDIRTKIQGEGGGTETKKKK